MLETELIDYTYKIGQIVVVKDYDIEFNELKYFFEKNINFIKVNHDISFLITDKESIELIIDELKYKYMNHSTLEEFNVFSYFNYHFENSNDSKAEIQLIIDELRKEKGQPSYQDFFDYVESNWKLNEKQQNKFKQMLVDELEDYPNY